MTLKSEYRLALQAIVEASEIILKHYERDIDVIAKEDGSPVTQADIQSANRISEILEQSDLPIMCEEHEIPSYVERQEWNNYWCVDPLDGTKMFLERNGEFAVNIALMENKRPSFGAIGSPIQQEILIGIPNEGVFIAQFADIVSPEKWTRILENTQRNNPLRIVCSRSYRHGSGYKLIQELERNFGEVQFIHKGSALKFFDLATGSADLYTRFGPTMEWDTAAGDAILSILGGQLVQIDNNQAIRYNKESLYNPSFIAKTKALLQV